MARKVFLSVLGTGFYGLCKYKSSEREAEGTRFVQKALLELNEVKDWSESDVVYVLLTSKAKEMNWEPASNKRFNLVTKKEEEYKGLKDEIAEMSLKAQVKDIDIVDGNNEDGIWQIFSTVYGLLEDGDELFVDLTHAFRFIPMLILVLSNYAKFLKGVEIKGISYGNFEACDKDTNVAPIVDLLPLVRLQDWTIAAAEFTKSGMTDTLQKLSSDTVSPFLRASKGADSEAKDIKNFVKQLSSFTEEIHLCRGFNLIKSKEFNLIHDNYKRLKASNNDRIKPLTPIIDKAMESIDSFVSIESSYNMLVAAKWSLEKENYQAAVTLMLEGIKAKLCEQAGFHLDSSNVKDYLECAGNALYKKKDAESYKPSDNEVIVDRIMNAENNLALLSNVRFLNDFFLLGDIRNDFNHSGMRGQSRSSEKLKKILKDLFDSLFACFDAPTTSVNMPPKRFINFTNHPSSGWGKTQLQTAKNYGEVIDVPFPKVDPKMTAAEVKALADESVKMILNVADGYDTTVHIMGEMNLCFLVIGMLMDNGIRCVASTTERNVVDNPDGTRTVSFEFKSFREYER